MAKTHLTIGRQLVVCVVMGSLAFSRQLALLQLLVKMLMTDKIFYSLEKLKRGVRFHGRRSVPTLGRLLVVGGGTRG